MEFSNGLSITFTLHYRATQDDQVFEVLLDRVEQHYGGTSLKSGLGRWSLTIENIVLMTSKNGAFVWVAGPISMHHDDRMDRRIEQNAFGNGMIWAGIIHGQRKSTMG